MNHKEINDAILKNRDIDESLVIKDASFYSYLFNNKVAYFYSECLSKSLNKTEEWIIKRGEELNTKYINTIFVLKNICDQNDIDFLLYKTYKYIPEVVDGDIDIFIKREDFNKFLEVFEKQGFCCIEDEPGKGKCVKDGYLVIEPHISISWRGGNYIPEKFIWEKYNEVYLKDGFMVKSASFEIELISLLGKVYFEPSYLDLYSIKQIKNYIPMVNFNNIYSNINFINAFKYLLSIIQKQKYINKKIPLFLPNFFYIKYWTKQSFNIKNIRTYFLHIIFFFYWKYRYLYFNKLPFTHNWDDKNK